jgi:hypothetical protein
MLAASHINVSKTKKPSNHCSVSVSVDLSQGNEHDTSAASFVLQ